MRATAKRARLGAFDRYKRRIAGGAVCLLLVLGGCGSAGRTGNADAATTLSAASTTAANADTTAASVVPGSTRSAAATTTTTATANAKADIPCGTTTTSMVNTGTVPVALTISYTCYDVTGSTPSAIRASIDANAARPVDPDTGAAYDAFTRWRYELHWTLATSAGACRATVSSNLTVDQTFPRWVASKAAATAPVPEWNTYVAALKTHEDGHRQIGIDTTNDAITRVSALGVASCGDFNAKAQAVIDAATARGRQVENEYDTATSHGATQGARFP